RDSKSAKSLEARRRWISFMSAVHCPDCPARTLSQLRDYQHRALPRSAIQMLPKLQSQGNCGETEIDAGIGSICKERACRSQVSEQWRSHYLCSHAKR
ncbi:hypothetical protein PENTCL1PPCAC_15962, partial [Pristionchus entomophagus]